MARKTGGRGALRASIIEMADSYSKAGKLWMPGLPMRGEQVGEELRSAFVAGANFALDQLRPGEFYGRTQAGELIGPYATAAELDAELRS